MSRQSLGQPLGVIIGMLVLVWWVLLAPAGNQFAAPRFQGCATETAGYPLCQTQTAAGTATATTVTATGSTATSGTPGTATSTATRGTTTPGTTTVTNTPGPSASNAPTASNTSAPVTLPSPTPVNGAVPCLPGSMIVLRGKGPASTALLLYFGGRAVGGAVSDEQGFYSLHLTMGREKPGIYPVQARVRGTQRVLREAFCLVPYFSPTPTPARRRPT